jgi:hypothetical protein
MDTLGDDYILIPQDFGMIRSCFADEEQHVESLSFLHRKINV